MIVRPIYSTETAFEGVDQAVNFILQGLAKSLGSVVLYDSDKLIAFEEVIGKAAMHAFSLNPAIAVLIRRGKQGIEILPCTHEGTKLKGGAN